MRKSRASFECLSLMDEGDVPRLPNSLASLSGVRGGVDISELLEKERMHGIGREKFEGFVVIMGNFAREGNATSGKHLLGEDAVSLGNADARLPVTQSDDPLSGGHFAWGASKAPLWTSVNV